jgi:ABC-type glycerol-3-phosphate transport system permease component
MTAVAGYAARTLASWPAALRWHRRGDHACALAVDAGAQLQGQCGAGREQRRRRWCAWTLENYGAILGNGQTMRWLLNSCRIGRTTIGRADPDQPRRLWLRRLEFRGARFLFLLVLMGLAIPGRR